MKIYTGNFANLKKYTKSGLHPISIALSSRYFSGDLYRPLNPDKSFLYDDEKSYIPKFNKKLSNLNPYRVFDDLKNIGNKKNVVLLCHEGEDKFCHRHLVAKWLTEKLGIEVKELGKMQKEDQLSLFADLV